MWKGMDTVTMILSSTRGREAELAARDEKGNGKQSSTANADSVDYIPIL
jgi:hypothetical protein